jgi:hypothetical protein
MASGACSAHHHQYASFICAGIIDEHELAAAVDTIISEQRMRKVGSQGNEYLQHMWCIRRM